MLKDNDTNDLQEHDDINADLSPNYLDIDFGLDGDNAVQNKIFNDVKNIDKARKLQIKDKEVSALEVDANLVDMWVEKTNEIAYLAEICESDGSLDEANLDNILVNVFKIKQLTEYVRVHPEHVVKFGVAGISVPFSNLYSNISEAVNEVKIGIASDKTLQDAISKMFVANKSVMTTDNNTGMAISDIVGFNDMDDELHEEFDINNTMDEKAKPTVIKDILILVDIAASIFIIDKAVLKIDSDALIISDNYRRTDAFKALCTILASMMIMFIEDDSVNFDLLDGKL